MFTSSQLWPRPISSPPLGTKGGTEGYVRRPGKLGLGREFVHGPKIRSFCRNEIFGGCWLYIVVLLYIHIL